MYLKLQPNVKKKDKKKNKQTQGSQKKLLNSSLNSLTDSFFKVIRYIIVRHEV